MSTLLPACGPIARILVTQRNLFLRFVVAWRLDAMPADDRLIETTILVDVFRDKPEAITWVNRLPLQGRWVSVITSFELLAGCRNRKEQRTVTKEMRNYRMLLLTEDISRTALSWFTRFHLSHGIGFLNSLIGATALHQDLTVATLNIRHFVPLPGIRVERPY
jgi:predicted nucleic acid-binding protein